MSVFSGFVFRTNLSSHIKSQIVYGIKTCLNFKAKKIYHYPNKGHVHQLK